MSGPKILLLDIETSPHLGYFWGLFNQNIPISFIKEPTEVMCWAAKWLGEKKIEFRDWHEEDFLTKIHEMIDEADGIVHYNGRSFDMKHLNREFLLAKMKPPSPYKDIDLLTCVRANFKFASNKLEWVSVQAGYDGKVKHRGIQLWLDCMDDDCKAWKEMKKYNIQDVRLLEDMHNELRPWIKGYPNHGLFNGASKPTCTNCGGTELQSRGTYRTKVRTYRRYHCQQCGKWNRSRNQHGTTPDGTLV